MLQSPAWIGIAAVGVASSPLIWNILARDEYRHKTLTKLFNGKYNGCYALAAWIFLSSLGKDALVMRAIKENPLPVLSSDASTIRTLDLVGKVAAAAGQTLVLSSFYRLGITGTYLGDYFGILMQQRVTAFPFNWFENPMYLGSTLTFLGFALSRNSVVGVGLAAWVYAVYEVATRYFENPFTSMIYAERDKEALKAEAAPAR